MTNLQKLKKAIIKEIPEIVELGIGLEFSWKARTNERTGHYTIVDFEGDKKKGTYICVHKERKRDVEDTAKFDERIFTDNNFKILGRDITLADVLRVLGGDYYFGAGDGYFYKIVRDINDGDTQEVEMVRPGIKWYANKDLSLQSGKTIRWLTKIICKKNE